MPGYREWRVQKVERSWLNRLKSRCEFRLLTRIVNVVKSVVWNEEWILVWKIAVYVV